MTRRTVVIDDKLLEEARQVLGTRGIRATIEAGLREAIRRRRLEEFRRSLGTLDIELTLEELERLQDGVFNADVRPRSSTEGRADEERYADVGGSLEACA